MGKKPKDEMSWLKATRILAFRAVEKEDPEYLLRFIMRWYSREFYTPLHEVEEQPLDEVLNHFFECRYESMDEHEREEEAELLRMTAEELEEKERREEEEARADDEFEKQFQEEAKVHETTGLPKPAEAPAIPVAVMGQPLPTTFQELADKAEVKTIPENIEMKFIGADEMDEMESWDILGKPKVNK